MNQTTNNAPKNPVSHLHSLNLLVALTAGVISIVGGVYSLKTNFFSPKTGSLQGIVRDEVIAKPLLLATVEISEVDGKTIATINTNEEGRYSVGSVTEGDYTIKVSAPLHKVQSKEVKISQKIASTVNFDLVPEAEKVSPFPPTVTEVPRATAAPATTPYYPPATTPVATPMAGYQNQQIPATSTALPASTTSPAYSRRTSHRPYSRPRQGDFYGNQSANNPSAAAETTSSANPLGNILAQAAGQLIQGMAEKKGADGSSS